MKSIDENKVLGKAFLNACEAMELSEDVAWELTGIEAARIQAEGIDPDSGAGAVAKTVIEIYRKVFGLMGGRDLRHWLHTENRHTGGIPAEQIKITEGREIVLRYLESMR